MNDPLVAPFPYFGGKRSVVDLVWQRLGTPKHYIEPFCGSLAMLLGAKSPASLEVANDINGFIANFWRATKHQPAEVARWADYPVSHIDLGARHLWLMAQRERVATELRDAMWPGCAQTAGWWLYGQCCWIGSGWCEWTRPGQIPHISNAGRGIQAIGQIPHISNAGRVDLLTTAGSAAWSWLHKLAARLERVRLVHGSWDRCLNTHYGKNQTAVYLDPPYRAYESLYGCEGVADEVERWALKNQSTRIALCGHADDYPSLGAWSVVSWKRSRLTYGSDSTTSQEAIWFSPACDLANQAELFAVDRGEL